MASEIGNKCRQNASVAGNVEQIPRGICENVGIKENCETMETTYDNHFASGTLVPSNKVPLAGKLSMHVDGDLGISQVKCNDFAVIKQTLADICDTISTQDCSDINSNAVDGTQVDSGCKAASKDMMSSTKLEVTVNGVASENSIQASTNNDMMENNHEVITKVETEMYSNEKTNNAITAENCGNCTMTETLHQQHFKSEFTLDYSSNNEQFCNTTVMQNCNNIHQIMDQKNIKHEMQFHCCNSHLRSEGDQNVEMVLESDSEQSGACRSSLRDKELVKICSAKTKTVNPGVSLGTSKQDGYVESDSMNNTQETNGSLLDSCSLNENIVTETNDGLARNELVSDNQLHKEFSAPYEQHIPKEQRQASGINKQSVVANDVGTPSDDLLYIMSVVEGDMRDMGITTLNEGPEGQQGLANDQSNKLVDSENWDNRNNGQQTSTDGSESSEDGSTSSSSESSSNDSDSESEKDVVTKRTKMADEDKKFVASPPKTKDELCLSDLPTVELLDIVVDESVELAPLGEIGSILLEDALVIIKSFDNVPALDSDSILFLEDRSSFGKVFEIFGQVQSPHYCVRFNNENEIKSTNVEIGQTVYFAPDTQDLTNFVFLSQLKSNKGSDASWKYDQEPPTEVLEFSDDEAESRAKAAKKMANQRNKRNEAHRQNQGLTDVATRRKKQRPSGPNIRHQLTPKLTRPELEHQFPRQSCSHSQPPALRFPPKLQIPPREPLPRFSDQRMPLHPPPRGPPLHRMQPQFPCPPQFTELPNRPPPRNYTMAQGLLPPCHPQPRGGPGVPPPQTNEMWRQPFQMFTPPPPPPPPPPQQDILPPNNQLPPQNWSGSLGVGPQYLPAQRWTPRENAVPPLNQHCNPSGQPYTQAQGQSPALRPYVKEQYPQNFVIQSCQNSGAPEQNVGGISENI